MFSSQFALQREKSDLCLSPINVKCLLLTMKYIKGAEMSQKKIHTFTLFSNSPLLIYLHTLMKIYCLYPCISNISITSISFNSPMDSNLSYTLKVWVLLFHFQISNSTANFIWQIL